MKGGQKRERERERSEFLQLNCLQSDESLSRLLSLLLLSPLVLSVPSAKYVVVILLLQRETLQLLFLLPAAAA